jgi:AAA domain
MENRGIQAGDAVSILPYAGPYPMSAESLDRNMIEATVTSTNPMLLRLQDKTNAQLYNMLTENVEGNVYRIDKLANRMGFNRQLAAAVAMAAPLDSTPRRPSAELIQAITAMDENMVMSNLRASRGHEMTSTAALCSTPVAWNEQDQGDDVDCLRDASRLALERHGALEGLNASQALAVEGAATNRLTLVQGPPGTGKTAVAIRILQHWARLAVSEGSSNPILATSDSNIAVDNLVEGCANAGLRVVRLGRPEAIRPELLRFCIDRPPAPGSNSQQGTSAAAIKEKLKTIRNAQVVCCTCIGSGGDILEKLIFERVLLDHCQLPPTVLSTRAEEEGLGVPLFSRMVACGVPPCK